MAAEESVTLGVSAELLAPCLPTKAETRVPTSEITIKAFSEDEVDDWGTMNYEIFPDAMFEKIENINTPVETRIKALSRHLKAWLGQPGFHGIKAVHTSTGETMGIAGWHECGPHAVYPTTYSSMPEIKFPPWFVPNAWRDDDYKDMGMAQRMGWTDGDIAEIKAAHLPGWSGVFESHDRARLAQLGDRYHFYVAPVAVRPKWQGKGVGKELLMWGIKKADERGWPCILDAMPNSMPVYLHLGFKLTDEHKQFVGKDTQMVREPRTST